MSNSYYIKGMTCVGCVSKVQQVLEKIEGVEEVNVQLESPQLQVLKGQIPAVSVVNEKLAVAGDYQIAKSATHKELPPLPEIRSSKVKRPPAVAVNKKKASTLPPIALKTYRPLLLIVGFIAGVSLLAQYPFSEFSGGLWMRHFMAGFFIVFSFFKLLNIEGFASSYAMYDEVAARWKNWGYLYPFVELGLGVLYLINLFPFWTNLVTIVVLGVSSIGVIRSNLNRKKIKCACLGDVFNLPMSTVTIIEDVGMVAMAVVMIL
ncbi:MAG: MauE/DoxX family redox-associated membrane protein [Bacteroidota bacterium]